MIKIAPSMLSADFSDMGTAVENLTAWGADWVHLDVMDGSFVPNISFGPGMVQALRPHSALPFDVHLMVVEPGKWITRFADAGADILTFHVEADNHVHRTLQNIHAAGCKAGVVLNPATPLETLEYVLSDCDLVLLMSVNPGFGGQQFIPAVVDKVRYLRRMIDEKGLSCDIEVDGGVNAETALLLAEAGATAFVAGNSVFSAADPAEMIQRLRCGR